MQSAHQKSEISSSITLNLLCVLPGLLKIGLENAFLYSSNTTQMSWLIWGCRIGRACLHLLGLISVQRVPTLNFKRFPSCNENKVPFFFPLFSFIGWQKKAFLVYVGFAVPFCDNDSYLEPNMSVRVYLGSVATSPGYKYSCTGV